MHKAKGRTSCQESREEEPANKRLHQPGDGPVILNEFIFPPRFNNEMYKMPISVWAVPRECVVVIVFWKWTFYEVNKYILSLTGASSFILFYSI